jgi:hypothetical protein
MACKVQQDASSRLQASSKALALIASLLAFATAHFLFAIFLELGFFLRSEALAGADHDPTATYYSPRSTRVTLDTALKVLNSRSWLEMT